MFLDLVKQNRSYRRFDESRQITREELLHLIECARLTASTSNLQAIKYILSCTPEKNARIQPHTGWGKGIDGVQLPLPGHRPTGFVVICLDGTLQDNRTSFLRDAGIVAQTILLGATEMGLGGCMIGSVNREGLSEELGIPDYLWPALVVALGKPDEAVELIPMEDGSRVGYYSPDGLTHYLPKRKLEELLLDL